MAKQKLTVATPVGEFSRTTDSAYKFATVWNSPRAQTALTPRADGRARSGVDGRWAKDRGYGVTWHFTRPSPKKYGWDAAATLVGVFEVK